MLTFKVCVPLSAWVKPGLQRVLPLNYCAKFLDYLLLQLGNPFQEKLQSQSILEEIMFIQEILSLKKQH